MYCARKMEDEKRKKQYGGFEWRKRSRVGGKQGKKKLGNEGLRKVRER